MGILQVIKSIISRLIILSCIGVIIFMSIKIYDSRNGINDKSNIVTEGIKNIIGSGVTSNKIIGNILIEKSQIVYENGISKLTSKITNHGVAKYNLKFKVTFIANNGSVIAESIVDVGLLKETEIKYVDTYINVDVSNTKSMNYEMIM